MGFWIFMLVMVLLLPASMLGLGRWFMKQAPGKINYGNTAQMTFEGKKKIRP